ncbi:MAG: PQQ-dependent sugar dehydrogenase [Ardenticatenaceae bacterium]|nr:PQQ-dependent sugar dehydrogenase [Ardenticatenaceae bacterium]
MRFPINTRCSLTHGGRIAALLLLLIASSGCQTAAPAPPAPEPVAVVEFQPISDGPVLLRENISIRKIGEIGGGGVKLAQNPADGTLYFLRPTEGIFSVALSDPFPTQKVIDIQEITTDGFLTGMTFGPDGSLYVVANRRPDESMTQAVIQKGILSEAGEWSWQNLATTEPYPASNTNFDHLFNGIVVSPDNQWVFVNSGSRTDHGEVQSTGGAFPDTREVPLTSRIFRLPTSAVDLILPNDEAAQEEMGVLYAKGTRNAYDLAFAPNGDLFGVDNGPDADYPEELNWLREGLHYGFPWRFGDQDNPQQFSDYNPDQDNRLSTDFVAVQAETYQNDPDFPPPTESFTDPIINLGPDAAQYRDADGRAQNAAATGDVLRTFTPHRSPLGLVFFPDDKMPAYLHSGDGAFSAFVLSWGAAGGDLTDQGQDLLHLRLIKLDDHYQAVTHQIVRDFRRPIDAVLIENRLYVLEWDGAGIIWELTFEE